MKNLIIVFSAITFLGIFTTCKKEHVYNPAVEYITYDNGEGTIGAGGGKITLNDKNSPTNSVSIDIPSGTLETPTLITIRDIINELPDGVKSRINNAYEFLPDGLIFNNAINVTIKVPDNVSLDSTSFLGSFDINTGYLAWNQSEVDLTERTISTEINHFSHWVVGKVSGMKFFEKTYSYNLKNLPSNANFSLQFLLKNDITRSFKKWEAYSKTTNIFFQETASQDPDIWVGFVKTADLNLYGQIQLGGSWFGVVLWDLFSDKRFILLNDDNSWNSTISLATNYNNIVNNIERILTHEIGHYFGLNDIKEGSNNSLNSLMGGANIYVPLSICAVDLEYLKKEYPKINSLTDYQSAVGILKDEPMSSIACFIGSTLKNTFKVKVVDASGKGVPNVTIVFRLTDNTNNNIGYISEPVIRTDENGIGSLESIRLPDNSGTYLLSARTWVGGSNQAKPISCIFNIMTFTPSSNGTVVNLINTFGPNDSYLPIGGWAIGYSSNSSWAHAIGFTPDVTGTVLQYTITVYRNYGGNQLNAWLRTDAKNNPGALIEQFAFTIPSGSNDLKLISNSSIHPQLIKGLRYWLVIAPPNITTESFGWYRNLHIDGIFDSQGPDPNGPWLFMREDYAPTLRITGNAK